MKPLNHQIELGKRFDTGKKWIDASGNAHIVYGKYLSVGALPNATTKNVAHGESINLTGKPAFVKELFATNDTTIVGFPHASITTAVINATNVVITTGADMSAYDNGIVLIEFCL